VLKALITLARVRIFKNSCETDVVQASISQGVQIFQETEQEYALKLQPEEADLSSVNLKTAFDGINVPAL